MPLSSSRAASSVLMGVAFENIKFYGDAQKTLASLTQLKLRPRLRLFPLRFRMDIQAKIGKNIVMAGHNVLPITLAYLRRSRHTDDYYPGLWRLSFRNMPFGYIFSAILEQKYLEQLSGQVSGRLLSYRKAPFDSQHAFLDAQLRIAKLEMFGTPFDPLVVALRYQHGKAVLLRPLEFKSAAGLIRVQGTMRLIPSPNLLARVASDNPNSSQFVALRRHFACKGPRSKTGKLIIYGFKSLKCAIDTD